MFVLCFAKTACQTPFVKLAYLLFFLDANGSHRDLLEDADFCLLHERVNISLYSSNMSIFRYWPEIVTKVDFLKLLLNMYYRIISYCIFRMYRLSTMEVCNVRAQFILQHTVSKRDLLSATIFLTSCI